MYQNVALICYPISICVGNKFSFIRTSLSLFPAGVILHFDTPVLKDFYIMEPKVWFDLCCLIIAPVNVNTLIRKGRPGGMYTYVDEACP